MWYARKQKLIEGVRLISSKLSNKTFEFNFKILFESLRNNIDFTNLDTNYQNEITAIEEIKLADKTFLYISQRLNLFLMSPSKLQNDLTDLGFDTSQVEIILKLYSESTREIVKKLNIEKPIKEDAVTWMTKTILSVDDKNIRCKQPAVQLSLKTNNQELNFDNLGREELSNLFENFENIQHELDTILVNKN